MQNKINGSCVCVPIDSNQTLLCASCQLESELIPIRTLTPYTTVEEDDNTSFTACGCEITNSGEVYFCVAHQFFHDEGTYPVW